MAFRSSHLALTATLGGRRAICGALMRVVVLVWEFGGRGGIEPGYSFDQRPVHRPFRALLLSMFYSVRSERNPCHPAQTAGAQSRSGHGENPAAAADPAQTIREQ